MERAQRCIALTEADCDAMKPAPEATQEPVVQDLPPAPLTIPEYPEDERGLEQDDGRTVTRRYKGKKRKSNRVPGFTVDDWSKLDSTVRKALSEQYVENLLALQEKYRAQFDIDDPEAIRGLPDGKDSAEYQLRIEQLSNLRQASAPARAIATKYGKGKMSGDQDYWEKDGASWVRWHVLPRTRGFIPKETPKDPNLMPDPHALSNHRVTFVSGCEKQIDDLNWRNEKHATRPLSEGTAWCGKSVFFIKKTLEKDKPPAPVPAAPSTSTSTAKWRMKNLERTMIELCTDGDRELCNQRFEKHCKLIRITQSDDLLTEVGMRKAMDAAKRPAAHRMVALPCTGGCSLQAINLSKFPERAHLIHKKRR